MLWGIPQAQKLPQALAQAGQQILLLTIQIELHRQKHFKTHSIPSWGGGVLPLSPVLNTTTSWSEVGQMTEGTLRLACRVE